ncbi:MAG: enoyl-CoA hydratase-related protein [Nocardioides sp.]
MRWRDRRPIADAVAGWLSERPAGEAVEALGGAGVPVALSAPASAVLEDPHLRARGLFSRVAHPKLGELTVIGAPVRFWSDGSMLPAATSRLPGYTPARSSSRTPTFRRTASTNSSRPGPSRDPRPEPRLTTERKSMTDRVLYAKEGRIARLTLNSPENLNAWQFPRHEGGMTIEFREKLQWAREDDDITTVLIDAKGPSFSSGADVTHIGNVYGIGDGKENKRRRPSQRTRLQRDDEVVSFYRELFLFPKITVAQVQGVCLGLGFILVSCCDLAVAAEDARLHALRPAHGTRGQLDGLQPSRARHRAQARARICCSRAAPSAARRPPSGDRSTRRCRSTSSREAAQALRCCSDSIVFPY